MHYNKELEAADSIEEVIAVQIMTAKIYSTDFENKLMIWLKYYHHIEDQG